MKLIEIAAIGKNRELGINGKMIWHLPGDLKFFRQMTKGYPILMGRKTFESLPQMLPMRKHLILSSKKEGFPEEAEVYSGIDEFKKAARDKYDTVYVIGGGEIYKELIEDADELILTEIDAEADADTYFPAFDKSLYEKEIISKNSDDGISYAHVIYRKK